MTENSPHPPPRDAILRGENVCSAGAVWEAASFPRGQPAACCFSSPNHLPWPQHLLGPLSPLEKSFDS